MAGSDFFAPDLSRVSAISGVAKIVDGAGGQAGKDEEGKCS